MLDADHYHGAIIRGWVVWQPIPVCENEVVVNIHTLAG